MPKPSHLSNLSLGYDSSIKALEATRSKVESLLLRSEMTDADVEQVYAGLYVNAFTAFEALLEDVFFGILEETHCSSIPTIKRRVEIVPNSFTREIVLGGRNYLDWVPLENNADKLAERFLNDGKPFSEIDTEERSQVKRLHLLRNAVAHKSKAAKKKFEASLNGYTLLPGEKTPAGFLRSRPQGPSGLNQYQISVGQLESIVRKLCL